MKILNRLDKPPFRVSKGDRKISCVVSQGNKSEVKGSAKGSKK